MAQIRKGTTFSTGDQITASNLNAHVDSAILLPGAVTEQPTGTANSTDYILAADSSLKKLTISQLQVGGIKADGTVAMTGELQLSSSTPSAALKAASKGYVDSVTGALNVDYKVDQRIARTGDTMSGVLNLAGNASSALQAVPLQQLQSYANGSASLSANGYQVLPSGLILQWGVTSTFGGGSLAVTLPFAFPNQVLSVNVTLKGTGQYYAPGVTLTSRSVITINNNSPGAAQFYWMAIGN